MPTIYDVNAIAFVNSRGKMERLAVSQPMLTLNECDRQIAFWRDECKYKLIVSWVQVKYESGSTKIIHFNEYNWRKYANN